MELVNDIIATTMKRISLLSGGDPTHTNITEYMQGAHAKVDMGRMGVLNPVPYSHSLTVECSSTVEPTRINNKNTRYLTLHISGDVALVLNLSFSSHPGAKHSLMN